MNFPAFFCRINDFLFNSLIADKRVYLFIVVFFVYLLNPNMLYGSDTLATQLLPLSIIREFDFDLNEFEDVDFGLQLSAVNVNGRLVSHFPVFTALLAVPFYALFLLLGYPMESIPDIAVIAHFSSNFIAALSVVFVYAAVKTIADERKALYCSLIYAFATCTWSVSSMDLWQHGSSQLFLAVSLYFLLRGLREERFVAYSGFTLACAVASRPPNLLIALILLVYVLREHRKVFHKFVLWSLPPAVFLLSYSRLYLGSFLLLGQVQPPFSGWDTPLLYGLSGLLFSPSKGLFVHSPILILSFVGIYLAWKNKGNKLFNYLSISVFAMLLLWSKWWAWHGANSYGYRMLVDLTPILCLFLAPVLQKYFNKSWFKYLLILLVAYSVFVQVVGAFFFDATWETQMNLEYYPDNGVHPRYWSIKDSQLLYYVKKSVDTLARILTTL